MAVPVGIRIFAGIDELGVLVSVPGFHFLRFPAQIKRVADLWSGKDVHRFGGMGVHVLTFPASILLTAILVEIAQQAPAIFEAISGNAIQ